MLLHYHLIRPNKYKNQEADPCSHVSDGVRRWWNVHAGVLAVRRQGLRGVVDMPALGTMGDSVRTCLRMDLGQSPARAPRSASNRYKTNAADADAPALHVLAEAALSPEALSTFLATASPRPTPTLTRWGGLGTVGERVPRFLSL